MTDSAEKSRTPISLGDLIALNQEIAALVRAGIPLDVGLSSLESDMPGSLGELTDRLSRRVKGGASLADAVEAEGDAVPRVYRAVVRTGLKVGRLAEALESLTGYAKAVLELRRRINLALLYPGIVLMTAYALFVCFLVVFVPELEATYSFSRLPVRRWLALLTTLGSTLPYWGFVLPVLLVVIIERWIRSGRAALSISHVGTARTNQPGWIRLFPAITNFHRANFAELLALLLEQETPLPDAMLLASESVGDPNLVADAEQIAGRLRTGASLTHSLQQASSIPPFMQWMMSTGEHQSALAPALRQVTDIYRRRAMHEAEWIKMCLPVAMVIVIGGGATLIYALSLFLPLVELYRSLSVG